MTKMEKSYKQNIFTQNIWAFISKWFCFNFKKKSQPKIYIEHVNQFQVEDNNGDDDEEICSICWGSLSKDPNKKVCWGKCEHKLHSLCYLKWREINNTCPLCRQSMLLG